jgi:3-phosphoshikimate 1-carboxyvinyltransferase
MMGAVIKSKVKRQGSRIEEYPPIIIQGGNLRPIKYRMPVASAQVKSAIILAGLFTKGETSVIEPVPTRDHTERMLKLFGSDIKIRGNAIVIKGGKELIPPGKVYIPGDISSAAFFLIPSAIIPGSRVLIRKLSLNPSRTGIIKVLERMGADIKVQSSKFKVQSCEPMGDILVRSSSLRGTVIRKEEIPSLIDEIPILMVAACFACGRTIFEGAGELRVKETDRIRSMSENLKKMGANISLSKVNAVERIIIKGVKHLEGTKVRSFGDHRTAMSMVAAGLAAEGETTIDDISCINKSFPGFISALKKLMH